jgi:hypothetical protein
MLTHTEYSEARARIDAYEAWRATLPTPWCISIEEQASAPCEVANKERSAVDVYEFTRDKPERYFVYINEKDRLATTWMGDRLGNVSLGREWRDNLGGKRVSITIRAINGETYHGTFYKSAGDYARIKKAKRKG